MFETLLQSSTLVHDDCGKMHLLGRVALLLRSSTIWQVSEAL